MSEIQKTYSNKKYPTKREKVGIESFTGSVDFVTISKKDVARINARLPEFYRASSVIGTSTSQSSYSLQTMQMMSDSPLTRMKQCLSQINEKYGALQHTWFKMEKLKLENLELQDSKDLKDILLIRENQHNLATTSSMMESTLRQIGMFQDMYDSIKKNNNIPDNWSEKDFEKQDIENMIRASFRLAIQELSSSGRVNLACVEYWEQLGIHPQVGEVRTRFYLQYIQDKIQKGEKVTIKDMYKFLDDMLDEFKDSYKDALKRIGLDEIGSESFMADGATRS